MYYFINSIKLLIRFFAEKKGDLEELLPELKEKLNHGGKLWVSYYKGTSKIKTDLNRDSLREYGLSIGLKAVGLISINKDWSSMRFKILE